jgi:hypothetical protein
MTSMQRFNQPNARPAHRYKGRQDLGVLGVYHLAQVWVLNKHVQPEVGDLPDDDVAPNVDWTAFQIELPLNLHDPVCSVELNLHYRMRPSVTIC